MTEDMTPTTTATGHDRPLCGATKRDGSGTTCRRPAGWGTDHPGIGRCKLHGGKTESHTRAAQREQAARDVALFGARKDIHPAQALTELVQWTAGEVDYWRARVAALDEDELTWGVVRIKSGGPDQGTTREARPNIAYSMYVDATKRLEAHSVAALRAGVDEKRLQLAEAAGQQLASVVRAVLDQMLAALLDGLGEALAGVDVVAVWQASAARIVPAEFRRLGEAQDGAA